MKLKINHIFILLFLLTGLNLSAQNADSVSQKSIFDTVKQGCDSIFIVSDIVIYGNKKTKDKIILRELEFKLGDTLDMSKIQRILEKSTQNLDKTSLFNYVTLTYQPTEGFNSFLINIAVEERWYIWPQVDIAPHNGNLNEWLRDPDFGKIDYSFGVKRYNFRGMKESVFLDFRRGFNNITQIGYNDIAIEKSRKNLLSFLVQIHKRKSGVLRITDNKAKYIDFEGVDKAFKEYKYEIMYTYRPKINIKNNFSVSYTDSKIHDSVAFYNPDYFGDGKTRIEAVNLSYSFQYDKRNSSYYPLEGEFFRVVLRKNGLFSKDIDTYKGTLDMRVYRELCPRMYFASQVYGVICSDFTPFYFRETIGAKPNVVPGYEKRQISATRLAYIQTSYKFELLKTHILEIKRLNIPKFNKIHYALYFNFFANSGLASREASDAEDLNKMNGSYLGAIGAGIDFVTYYDRVLSVYYTKNVQGDGYLGIGIRAAF
ncbi:MAG: hypothetical protein II956_16445 [Bacteroidales bacterium]|nr:hypothetical protein [Bacteroidales bacterium]